MTAAVEFWGENRDIRRMALITCTDCGNQVSDRAAACPKCGGPMHSAPAAAAPQATTELEKRGPSVVGIVVAVIAALFVALFITGWRQAESPAGQERAKDRRTIELCWEEQRRKSLDPAEARFIAGACEMMEDKFRTKHGRNP